VCCCVLQCVPTCAVVQHAAQTTPGSTQDVFNTRAQNSTQCTHTHKHTYVNIHIVQPLRFTHTTSTLQGKRQQPRSTASAHLQQSCNAPLNVLLKSSLGAKHSPALVGCWLLLCRVLCCGATPSLLLLLLSTLLLHCYARLCTRAAAAAVCSS
jgi:hypothetical protein